MTSSHFRRILPWLPVLLATTVLLVAGCGEESGSGGSSTASDDRKAATERADEGAGADAADAEDTVEAEAARAREAAGAAKVFRAAIEGGLPAGGPQVWRVSRGDEVRIAVTSDTADELHLHGYDISADVEAGGRAQLVLTATQPGSFELELEDAGVLIGNLEVR